MARSGARNATAPVRPSDTSPPQQFPGAQMSSCANPSPPPHFYPGAPTSSSTNPSTPPHFYPGAPTSSSNNPCMNQWRPLYTPAPEGLLSFGQIPPMHMYNFQPPPMHHHEQGNRRMENLHFVGTSPHVDLETMALEKYEANYGHPFQHLTMWVKLRDDGKWLACYNRMIAKAGKSPPNAINLEGEQRPLAGRDKAKTEHAGKDKAREVSQELGEKLDKFIEVNNQSMEERQKVMETQVFLSNRQLETAKITNKTKMLDVYQNLLLADTSRMDDAAKAGRAKALKSMESMLFSEGDSGDQGE